MWLLDANMDVHLVRLLAAKNRGWAALSNGELVTVATANGFECLLARDRLFRESASRALGLHPTFAVVLIRLPQQPWPDYQQRFRHAWTASRIQPQAGRFIEWPT